MLNKEKIELLVNTRLKGTDKFLVGINISSANVVDVYVDGDQGISISECVKISRLIENNFDRVLEDYELRVSSPGLDKPFSMIRQYMKYIGREIKLVTNENEKFKGKLLNCSDIDLELEITRGKKGTDKTIKTFTLKEINEARPVISFK